MTEVILNVHMLNAKVHAQGIDLGTFFTASKIGEVETGGAVCFKSGVGIHVLSGPAQGTTPALYTDNKWVFDYKAVKLVRMEFSRD